MQDNRSKSLLDRTRRVALPHVLKGLRKSLLLDRAIHMAGVSGKDELIVIALGRERLCHALIGQDPVMHVVAHNVRIEEVAVSNFHPDSYRLTWTIGNQVFVKFPRPVR